VDIYFPRQRNVDQATPNPVRTDPMDGIHGRLLEKRCCPFWPHRHAAYINSPRSRQRFLTVTLLFGASVLVSAFASFGNNALNGNGANGRFTSTAALNRSNRNDEDAAVGSLFQWHKRLPLLARFGPVTTPEFSLLLGVNRKLGFRACQGQLLAQSRHWSVGLCRLSATTGIGTI
jgi:hypothetical protein